MYSIPEFKNQKTRDSAPSRERMRNRLRTRNTIAAGIFDICMRLNLIDENINSLSRGLLLRIVSMLSKMTRISSGTQTVTHTFT